MKNNNSKVSVIMSVYNGKKYLKKSIESILNQTFRDFELIIVDDCSTDRSGEILSECAKKDKRIKIINNPQNIGLTKSLNKALKEARGEYIARMDADDISLPERLERQVDFMKNHSEVGLVSCYSQFIDEKGNFLRQINRPRNIIDRKNLFFNARITHSSVMIRRNILAKIGIYDEKFLCSQDADLILRISQVSKIATVPEILILWREQKNSISAKKKWDQVKFGIIARAKAIHSNLYPKYYYLFLLFFLIKFFIPTPIRKFLRKML